MNRMLKASVLLALAASLAACGSSGRSQDNATAKPPAAQTAEAAQDKPKDTVQQEAGKQPDSTGTAAEQPASGEVKETDSETKEPADVQAAPLYRMNKAYRFVPIDKTKATDKVVLLTFDDGPKEEAQLTDMLDTLDKHKAKAIFFVNGYRVKQNPQLLKLIHDRGQTIGNHSWDHIDLKKEDKASVEKQVGDVSAIVKETVGAAPKFFRPPFGSGNDSVKAIVKNNGMLYMTWSNGSLDWDRSTKDKPDAVIANVLEQLHPGANILMHELPWTRDALDDLLSKLEAKGYGFIDPATIEVSLSDSASASVTK